MKEVQVALYARVSSEQQAEAKTIESQLAEIRTVDSHNKRFWLTSDDARLLAYDMRISHV